MHSPLEIARNYIEVGIHKVNLSIFKTILLGFFAGMFIGFAGIASTTASSTIGIFDSIPEYLDLGELPERNEIYVIDRNNPSGYTLAANSEA